MLLELRTVSYSLDGQGLLFEDINVSVNESDKIGIVGRNGCGKSTLLNVIDPHNETTITSAGELLYAKGKRVLMVKQQLVDSEESPYEFLLRDNNQLQNLYTQLETASDDKLEDILAQIGEIEEAYETEAGKLLSKMGLTPEEISRPMKRLSHGYQMRIAIVSAILQKPDLLLLDEPTNHLDIDSSEWLKSYLKTYPGAIISVSHDVDFLDATTNKTWHLKKGHLATYSGSYSSFSKTRTVKETQALKDNSKVTAEIERQQAFISKFKGRPSRAGQCSARAKMVAKLKAGMSTLIPEPPIIPIQFQDPESSLGVLLKIESAQLGYVKDSPVLRDVNLSIISNERLIVVGKNGQGKSTLIKSIAGILPSLQGNIEAHRRLKTAYYNQEVAGDLVQANSLLAEVKRIHPSLSKGEITSLLIKQGFNRDKLEVPVSVLSGGEKARLVFAIMSIDRPDLIILDEPTNHLDIETQNELLQQIKDYKGALVIVSHDTQLLRSVINDETKKVSLLQVTNGKVKTHSKDLASYIKMLTSPSPTYNKYAAAGGGGAPSFFSSAKPMKKSSLVEEEKSPEQMAAVRGKR